MKQFIMKAVLISSIFNMAILLAACISKSGSNEKGSSSEVRIGVVGIKSPGRMNFKFQTFTGKETSPVILEAGQTMRINYQAALNKGRITLELHDPAAQVVWQKILPQPGQDQTEVTAYKNGEYTLIAIGQDAGGSFDLYWLVK